MQPLNREQRALAEDAADMADTISHRWERLYPRYADSIRSSAMMGAMSAAESFEPAHPRAVWHKWAHLRIESSIIDALRCSGKRPTCSLTQGEQEDIVDHRASDALEDAMERAISLLGRLPSTHKSLCNLVYREGMDPTTASRALGFSQSYGCRLHREAIVLMRDMARH